MLWLFVAAEDTLTKMNVIYKAEKIRKKVLDNHFLQM